MTDSTETETRQDNRSEVAVTRLGTWPNEPSPRMGPPPRSFAADAHDCIMAPNRIQVCGAISARPDGELPSELGIRIRIRKLVPTNRQPDAVLATVKGKSLRDGLRPPLTVAARRVLRLGKGRDEERVARDRTRR